jgi:hypothetical protein
VGAVLVPPEASGERCEAKTIAGSRGPCKGPPAVALRAAPGPFF